MNYIGHDWADKEYLALMQLSDRGLTAYAIGAVLFLALMALLFAAG